MGDPLVPRSAKRSRGRGRYDSGLAIRSAPGPGLASARDLRPACGGPHPSSSLSQKIAEPVFQANDWNPAGICVIFISCQGIRAAVRQKSIRMSAPKVYKTYPPLIMIYKHHNQEISRTKRCCLYTGWGYIP